MKSGPAAHEVKSSRVLPKTHQCFRYSDCVRDVLIRGEGVAAYSCAYLLGAAGFRVVQERIDRTRLPAILLNESTQALLSDVFGRRDLFEGIPRIDRRVVAWGPNAT